MEIRLGYKKTDAGVLPVTWQVAMLGEHVKITSGISPSLLNFSDDGLPYFKVEQLSNTDKYLDGKLTPYHFKNGPKIEAGSVIFAKRGAAIALNKIRVVSEQSFMDTNLMALTPSAELDVGYLYYGLGYIGLWRFADTTSVPQINNKHIKPLAFPLPEIHEQRAISTALSDVDALIAGLEKLIAKKRDLKQASMQQLLSGQTRLPGFSGEWEVKRLGELANVAKGRGLSKGKLVGSGANSCILYGELFTTYERVITSVVSKTNSSEGHLGLRGDVLLPGSTTTKAIDLAVACAMLVDDVQLGGDINVVRMKNESSYDPIFMANLLTHTQKLAIADLAQGSTIIHLYGRNLLNLTLKLPVITEQTAIATVLSEMDTEITTLKSRLAKTSELKQGMMQELLTGRTRLI